MYLAAVLLIAAAGCKNGSMDQKLAEYKASTDKFVSDYNDAANEIFKDSTLTKEEQNAKFEKWYEETVNKFVEERKEIIKKNASNELGAAALNDIWNMVEDEEQPELLAQLKGKAAQDSTVLKHKAYLQAVEETAEGKMFTDFTVVQDADNAETSTVKFSDYVGKGKYILVDFWASWCGPCKREIPNIAAVYEKYAGDDFDVLSVAVWDKPEDTVAAAKEHGVVWNQIINAQRIPTDIYGIQGIPHIMLVGPDGTIVKRGLRGEAIEKAVAEALGR